ncbi:MAG: hypothetical protein HKN87_10230 [Saprospiraceae bacterium]|nr:hypothetical protein [Saprospiraceae bacterium]
MKSLIASLFAILIITGSSFAQRSSHFYKSALVSIGPDLVVTSIKVPNSSAQYRLYSGNTIKLPVEVTIRNRGNDLARNSFGIYTNLKIGSKKKDGERISRLSPGQSRTFKMTAHIPASYSGRRISLTSTVDPPGGGRSETGPAGGFVKETNEKNNSRRVSILVPVYQRMIPKNL